VRKWGIRGFELMGLRDMEDTKGIVKSMDIFSSVMRLSHREV
jgi:hypothetical protein